MQLYRYTSGNPINKTIYFMPPDDTGDYAGPLLAESTLSQGARLPQNISHLDPMAAHDEIVHELQALHWQGSYSFSVPAEMLTHPALPEEVDIATISWSIADAPNDIITHLEDIAIRADNARSNRLAPYRRRTGAFPFIMAVLLGRMGWALITLI